jgi:hypothetical protein
VTPDDPAPGTVHPASVERPVEAAIEAPVAAPDNPLRKRPPTLAVIIARGADF